MKWPFKICHILNIIMKTQRFFFIFHFVVIFFPVRNVYIVKDKSYFHELLMIKYGKFWSAL